jgi:hypothetical protein
LYARELIQREFDRLIKLIKLEDLHKSQRWRDLLTYVAEMLKQSDVALNAQHDHSFTQGAYMLGSNIDRMLKKAKLHAAQEGREEGRSQGKRELLLKMLQLKFGASSADREQRVAALSDELLERAAERILTASSEEQVFE